MRPTLAVLNVDATKAVAFLEGAGREHDLPFLRSFPKNSCEAASAVVGLVAYERYSPAEVCVARGYNAARADWHFWVEVGGYVLDVTAHQFDGYEGPVVTPCPSPLEREYADVERLDPIAAMQNFSTNARAALMFAASELAKALSAD